MELQGKDLHISIGVKQIVSGVSFHASQQQLIGIIGPNGSGKSTLLKTVYRVLKADSGTILLDGKELSSMTLRESAQKLGVMSQINEFNFDFTVEKMVRMGRTPYKQLMEPDHPDDLALVDSAMQQTGVTHLRDRDYSTLSGGEKQRVLIARTLAQQTPCLILDEPTNHLDIKYQLQLMELVKSLKCTVIAAIHDLNIAAMYCDYLYALKNGKLVGEGSPQSLLTEAFIQEVYEVSARVVTDRGHQYIHYIPTVF